MHAFTAKSNNGLANELSSPISILIPNTSNLFKTNAIWDTGATASVITSNIVASLGLIATGMSVVHTANGTAKQSTYIVDIQLPNNVLIKDVTVTEVPILNGRCDVLIGMDVINIGDFSVTNHNNITCMSFRLPSSHEIDYTINPIWKHSVNVLKKSNSISRNHPCTCGSGKKFKHCCGK